MAKAKTFEENIDTIDQIIEKLENGMDLDDSIKEYEKAMKLIGKSNEILEHAQGKIKKVIEIDNKIVIEDFM